MALDVARMPREQGVQSRPKHRPKPAGGGPLVQSSSVNFVAYQTRANNAVTSLGAAGDLAIFAGLDGGSVAVIVDVTGYFE